MKIKTNPTINTEWLRFINAGAGIEISNPQSPETTPSEAACVASDSLIPPLKDTLNNISILTQPENETNSLGLNQIEELFAQREFLKSSLIRLCQNNQQTGLFFRNLITLGRCVFDKYGNQINKKDPFIQIAKQKAFLLADQEARAGKTACFAEHFIQELLNSAYEPLGIYYDYLEYMENKNAFAQENIVKGITRFEYIAYSILAMEYSLPTSEITPQYMNKILQSK
jgi:hypothetical protein